MNLIQPSGAYALGACLHKSATSHVYAATRKSDGHAVVLKAYAQDEADSDSSHAQREFDALRQVEGPGIVRALELIEHEGPPLLVLDRIPGPSLASWVREALPSPEVFVDIAIQLTDALARVHDVRLLHRDVTPHNVLIDPDRLQVCLIDFGLARPLGSATRLSEGRPEAQSMAGSLSYIPPEQTGRMDRGIDFRSDLYGLGATLYVALTGSRPFDTNDPLALIHAHMAKMPVPPVERRPEVPATLSRIVTKLLQKSPEARYQTARALHTDLCECRAQLQRTGSIENDLPLGTADAPYRPLFVKHLYGRENEIRVLLDAYVSAAAGSCNVVLLQGAPGIGKSALVHELRVPLANSGGYLAQGKFDLYRRDVPYFGFAQAFESLAQQMLTESDASLTHWRAELVAALGPSAGVLVGLVPALGLVLGEVAPVLALGPQETRARLSLAVQRFIHAFASREHPLVLFLDDLQWADAGSRDLLQELLPHVRERALLLLGSYRDTEVDASHPLMSLIRELEQREIAIHEIPLTPLSDEACAQMLAKALGRTEQETRSLATCVARKTGNTPLLIQQFVYHMYDLGLIRFRQPVGWSWDEAELTAAAIPDDAVGLMTAKIQRLASVSAAVLQLASCAGDSFDLETLAELTDRPRTEVESALFALCDEGLIVPARDGFRFVHDRIREAAQALLSSEERAHLHHQAARLLLERTPVEALPERAAEIADHLNLAHDLEEQEQLRAVELNVIAGQRALRAGAGATAAPYFAAARARFGNHLWDSHPQLGFDLFVAAAESAYLMRDLDLALELLATLEARPLSRMQAAQVAAKTILTRSLDIGKSAELVPFVLQTLRRFGVRWPLDPSRLRTRLALMRTEWILRGPIDEDMFKPIGAGDHSVWLAPILIMAAGGSTLASKTVRLVCLLTSHILSSHRRHGHLSGPAFALAAYASQRLGFLRHVRDVDRYAQAALEWNVRVPNPVYSGRTEFMVHAFLYPWIRPRRSSLEPLRKAAEKCREAGDPGYVFYANAQRWFLGGLAGEPLGRLVAETKAARTVETNRGILNIFDLQLRVVDLLLHSKEELETFKESRAIHEDLYKNSDASRMGIWVFWLQVLCLLGRHAEAFATAEEIATWIRDVGCMSSQVVDFTFFRGMITAELANSSRGLERRRRRRLLRRCLRDVRAWAHHGPDFLHMVHALQAEDARLRQRPRQALALYDRAIERATQQGYNHHAAFLYERRAQLLLASRRSIEATAALRQAITHYQEWGADGKARSLHHQLARTASGSLDTN